MLHCASCLQVAAALLLLAGTHTVVQPAGTAAAHLVQQGVKISINIIKGSFQLRHVAWVSLSS
jgi:hypothetical protein